MEGYKNSVEILKRQDKLFEDHLQLIKNKDWESEDLSFFVNCLQQNSKEDTREIKARSLRITTSFKSEDDKEKSCLMCFKDNLSSGDHYAVIKLGVGISVVRRKREKFSLKPEHYSTKNNFSLFSSYFCSFFHF